MVDVNVKQVYEYNINNDKKWILIIFNISKNHYIGIPVYNETVENGIFLKSIRKYAVVDKINDFYRSNIKKCIYVKGKPIKISNEEHSEILLKSKDYFLNFIRNNTKNNFDGLSYNKWCKDKLEIINKNVTDVSRLKVGAICWVDLGYNIGNELRKLRPAILWRSSVNKKMWTIIPLTSKCMNDKYYFHYDLMNKKLGTAKIENLINISVNRIKGLYFVDKKIAIITKKDNDTLIKIIKKYYAFQNTNYNKKSIGIHNEKISEKRQKELTIA